MREYFDGEMWRSVLRDVGRVFRRYPFLAFPPLLFYMKLCEREALDCMVKEALKGDRSSG